MFGFKYYIGGITGVSGSQPTLASSAINQLGLALDTKGYILLGLSLFFSILVALALATILGAFAEDVKKVQGLILPITFLIMIPYILTMFLDVNSTSTLIKIIVYIIPFSHPFLASPNLLLHNYSAVIYGIIYQAVVFGVLVIIAGRIFSTDRILTMKLNFKKKSLFSR
jgi:ABC-2 type transport system permease protein